MKHGKREAKGKLDKSGGAAKKHNRTGKRKETAKRAARERWPVTGTAWLAQAGRAPELQTVSTLWMALREASMEHPPATGPAIAPLRDDAAAKQGMPVHLAWPTAGTLRLWQIEVRSEHRVLFSKIQYVILNDYLRKRRLAVWRVDVDMNDGLIVLLGRFCKAYGFPHFLFVPREPRLARVRRWAGRHDVAIIEIPPRIASGGEQEVRH